ncbi:uncharacterized protein RCC_01664 [Ramularia collo-cygni]|uniref:Uncharacterized protein n=1 Tax=Ramularia collo-cygni TaxID=112498 RepID=A0A2D3UPH9_9PEZI|nr:uncharacterized protein RCC_01664 [Ramularia collo-cygni]
MRRAMIVCPDSHRQEDNYVRR